ncbi:hypothetical protein R5R35_002281 [Gryllus longicercus]|uniref:Uncharacterized protein n=1 Tax=Gryllus longicercus TaxID=2509291 RepID=A0AAN9ZBX6_9ORTH
MGNSLTKQWLEVGAAQTLRNSAVPPHRQRPCAHDTGSPATARRGAARCFLARRGSKVCLPAIPRQLTSHTRMEAPAWLDRQLVQQALKGAGDEDARVERVEVRAAVPPGANFGSALYRVGARLVGGAERALLVKGPPPAPRTAAAVREAGLFAREAYMLADVVPRMEVCSWLFGFRCY